MEPVNIMLEEDATVMWHLRPGYPTGDVRSIAQKLDAVGAFVPGFIPAPAGFLSLETITYTALIERVQTIVLPDRNIVSRMAAIARSGMPKPADPTSQLAAEIMALCQAVDFDIEPSIAFHELAHRKGNDEALDELSWFRVADHNRHLEWIDIALGRASALPTISPDSVPFANLAAPLNRWNRNYAIALKVGNLELSPLSRMEMARSLIEWMVSDFIVAGPAALFATMYLSPSAAKARMMKRLRSENKSKALEGIQNAAWDITYLSEFVRMVKAADYSERRFILATGDRAMATLAGLLFSEAETLDEMQNVFTAAMQPWWGANAPHVAKLVCGAIEFAGRRKAPTSPGRDYVTDIIAEGEAGIRNWKSS